MTLLSRVKFYVEDFFKFCGLLRINIRTLKYWIGVIGWKIWVCFFVYISLATSRILKICFYFFHCACLRKQQQIFKIQNSTLPNQWAAEDIKDSSVAHWFRRVEFWIFVFIFSTALTCRKQQQIFDIQNSTRPNRWADKDIKVPN